MFTFQQDNDPKHTAKITKEWLQNNSATILDWPSQSPDVNPIKHPWRDLKMAVHQRSLYNLTELDRICKEEWQRIPKSSQDGVQSVTTQFKNSLTSLIEILMSKESAYIRCIKPNNGKQPGKFDDMLVRHQVKYLGLMEHLRVRRAGFAYRRKYETFLQRYKSLCPETWPNWAGSAREGVERLVKHIGYQSNEYKLGRTKLFIRFPRTLFSTVDAFELRKHQLACYHDFAVLAGSSGMQSGTSAPHQTGISMERSDGPQGCQEAGMGCTSNTENKEFVCMMNYNYLVRLKDHVPKNVLDKTWLQPPIAMKKKLGEEILQINYSSKNRTENMNDNTSIFSPLMPQWSLLSGDVGPSVLLILTLCRGLLLLFLLLPLKPVLGSGEQTLLGLSPAFPLLSMPRARFPVGDRGSHAQILQQIPLVLQEGPEGRPTKMSFTTAREIVWDSKKNPQITSAEIQDFLKTSGVAVSRCTIRRHLKKNVLHGQVTRRKPLVRKCYKVFCLQYAKQHRDKPQNFWNKVIWSDETKIELFGHNHKRYISREVNKAYDERNTIPTVKHGGGLVMFWGYVSYKGTGNLFKVEGKMNAARYQQVLEANLHSSAQKLRMGHTWTYQHDNDPKHKAKSTCHWLQQNKVKVLEWPI
ncbi:unnamed protein product [Ranitomeya imitator]|uniref:Myosin motor domain-containing protein n=1 Tax=Ranitomeya imitator TaxID=111125 RepID=A0ABN9LGR6_9NEOB|nr:unnamed protein product [Ranitomeya imitator]